MHALSHVIIICYLPVMIYAMDYKDVNCHVGMLEINANAISHWIRFWMEYRKLAAVSIVCEYLSSRYLPTNQTMRWVIISPNNFGQTHHSFLYWWKKQNKTVLREKPNYTMEKNLCFHLICLSEAVGKKMISNKNDGLESHF